MLRSRLVLTAFLLVFGLMAAGCGDGADAGYTPPRANANPDAPPSQMRTSLVDQLTTDGSFGIGRTGVVGQQVGYAKDRPTGRYNTPAEDGWGGGSSLDFGGAGGSGSVFDAYQGTSMSTGNLSSYDAGYDAYDTNMDALSSGLGMDTFDDFSTAGASYPGSGDSTTTPYYQSAGASGMNDWELDPTMDPMDDGLF